MKIFYLFFHHLIAACFIFFIASLHPEGFAAGTLVKIPYGYAPIEYLEPGDTVFCYDHDGRLTTSFIMDIEVDISYQPAVIVTNHVSIATDRDQLFYVVPHQRWLYADQARPGDNLLSYRYGPVIVRSAYPLGRPLTTYALSIREYHNFFVSEDDILVHN